jgi:hypothetical protein
MPSQPPFDEMVTEVKNEVISVVTDFTVLERVILPLMKQPKLLEHYPVLCMFLYQAVANGVVLALCRLFDPTKDRRHASLANVLRRIRGGERETYAGREPAPTEEQIAEFMASIPGWLGRISEIDGRLAIRRSGLIAHRDMSKKGRPELTIPWGEVRECIELARTITREYMGTFHRIYQLFELVNLSHEPEQFLQWTRLADYARHFAEDLKRRESEMRRQYGMPDKGQ